MTVVDAEDEGLWQEITPPAARRLAIAGLECFSEGGFQGTTTRDIAKRAELSPAAVYVHYPSKGELLYRISRIGHDSSWSAMERAAGDEQDPRRRIWLIVDAFAGWHARNHRLARVAQYELASLPPDRLQEILTLRKRFSVHVEAELERGVAEGCFDVRDTPGAGLAILSLCIDVARWYTPGGLRTPEELSELYADLILGMLGVPRGDERPGRAAPPSP
jgi:AcrR family transcriptional regulator